VSMFMAYKAYHRMAVGTILTAHGVRSKAHFTFKRLQRVVT